MKHEVRMTVNKGAFFDEHGRTRILRGCTISGDSKIPVHPDGRTHLPESLSEKKSVSFTGRPFPEEEADTHFLRLKQCGFTLLRWIITWEAVEHDGPEEYDENYLAYLRNLIKKAEEYGFYVILDPCMNAFSRWTGGCGAPAWVLEKLGMDLTRLDAAGAAYTHSAYLADPNKDDSYDWRINYRRYATQTLFTLFYGGHTYAPGLTIDGDPVQDYLQEHFINAMNHTARRLKDCDAIIGFSLPSNTSVGYIGTPDIRQFYGISTTKGLSAAPFECMKAASGFDATFFTGSTLLSSERTSTFTGGKDCGGIWMPGYECPWKTQGVWDIEDGTPLIKKPDYFAVKNGKPTRFFQDFLKPFQESFIETLQKKHSHYLFLVDDTVDSTDCDYTGVSVADESIKNHIVQKFSLFEPSALLFKTNYDDSLSTIDEAAASKKAGITPLISSVPISFSGKSNLITGILKSLSLLGTTSKDTAHQEDVLNQLYTAFDAQLLSVTLWNYTSGNTQEFGDGWNEENNSIYDGATRQLRAQKGYCWPYAIATQGRPVRMHFDTSNPDSPVFTFEWDSTICSTASGDADTELFIPKIWFPKGWKVEKFDGVGQLREFPEQQRLYIKTLEERRCSVRITADH